MILVTGATGTAGAQVVQALRERGRRCARSCAMPSGRASSSDEDVELALGDFADTHAVRAALDGVDAVFLSGADDPRRVEWETSAIDAAAAAGVRRIVKLSSIVAEPGARGRVLGLARSHRAAPAEVRRPRRVPPLQLLHGEPARGRRAGRARGPALRARGRGEDRDGRHARRRRRRRGRAHDARSRRHGRYVLTGPRQSPTRRSPPSSPRRSAARWGSSTCPARTRSRQ